MYKIVCKDYLTGKRHTITFESKSSVFEYVSMVFHFIDHGKYTITNNGKFLRSLVW